MSVSVRPCTVAELEAAPNLAGLISEYSDESSAPELGSPNPQFDLYRLLEQNGLMHPVGAFVAGRLAGFILPIVSPLPHYGVSAATVESFFVTRDCRRYGLGQELLAQTRQVATEARAKVLLVGAPPNGVLAKVLEASKRARLIHHMYIEGLA